MRQVRDADFPARAGKGCFTNFSGHPRSTAAPVKYCSATVRCSRGGRTRDTRPAGPPLGFRRIEANFPRQVLHRQQARATAQIGLTVWTSRRSAEILRIAVFQPPSRLTLAAGYRTFAEVPAMNLPSSSLHGKGPFTRLGVSNDGVARDATLCRPIERESARTP